jgi:hypothetical protein
MTDKTRFTRLFQPGLAILLIGLAIVCFVAWLNGGGGLFFDQTIELSNKSILKEARTAATTDLVTLAAILGVVEVVSSTEIGVDFLISASVEVGQSLSTLVRVLELSISAIVFSAVLSELYLFVIAVAAALNGLFLSAALCSAGLFIILRLTAVSTHFLSVFRTIVIMAFMAFTSTHLVIPYTIQINGWIVSELAGQNIQTQRKGLNDVHDVIAQQAKAETIKDWGKKSIVKNTFQHLHVNIVQKIEAIARFMWSTMAHALLFGLILPILILIVFYAVTMISLRQALKLVDRTGD